MKNYTGHEVTVNFSGLEIEGHGDDEFVRIEQSEETFTVKMGTGGEVTRSKRRRPVTRVTITLMQTSSYNDKLSAIHQLDLQTEGGSGIGPLLIRDRQGTTNFMAPEAWIVGWPNQAFAAEAGTVEWVIDCANPERHVGGN